jgi:hypothetical protein
MDVLDEMGNGELDDILDVLYLPVHTGSHSREHG